MNKIKCIFIFLLCLILFISQLAIADDSGQVYEPHGENEYDPPTTFDWGWCSSCFGGCFISYCKKFNWARTDTIDEVEPGSSLVITPNRCSPTASCPVINVELGEEEGYEYSKAHTWGVSGEIWFIKDRVGASGCSESTNTETWTCASWVTHDVPVTCQGTAGYRIKHYENWSYDTYEYTVDVYKICVDDDPIYNMYHPLDDLDGVAYERTLESESYKDTLSSICVDGVEDVGDCGPCGTEGSPSGPCTGNDCPNSYCSHY